MVLVGVREAVVVVAAVQGKVIFGVGAGEYI
jgi:hypothetical protein